MTWFAAHFDVSKEIYNTFENVLLCKPQIDDLQSSNEK